MNLYRKLLVFDAYVLGIFILFQWISLFDLGGLKIKSTHLFLFLVPLLTIFKPFRQSLISFVFYFRHFIITYTGLLIIYLVAGAWSDDVLEALKFLIKSSTYFFVFIFTGAFTIEIIRLQLTNSLLKSVPIGLVLFILYCFLVFFFRGDSFINTFTSALLSGNPQEILYKIYKPIFNFDFLTLSMLPTEEALLVNLKNNLATGFLLYYILINIFQNQIKSSNLLYSITKYGSLLLVLLTLSRSNMISLILVILFYLLIKLLSNKYYLNNILLAVGLSLALLFSIALSYSDATFKVFETITGRFADIENASRFEMYDIALKDILEKPILGYGTASKLQMESVNKEYLVHNFLLKNWYMCGILGLILASAYYVNILSLIFSRVYTFLKTPNQYMGINFNMIWVLCLPIQPLFRALVSSGTDFAIVDWIMLSMFFAFVYIYDKRAIYNRQARLSNIKYNYKFS